MPRILQYIGSLAQGGSQSMIMNIYRNIDRDVVQFDFVIDKDGITDMAKEAESLGANIYICPPYRVTTLPKFMSWWNNFFVTHPEYKLIHCHVHSVASIVLGIAKKHAVVTVCHSHSTSAGNGMQGALKRILEFGIRFSADYCIGCSSAAGEWLFGKKICNSNRYVTLHNAIRTEDFVYNETNSKAIRQELGFSKTDIVVGHVGRFALPKNHMFLIDVFDELHKKDERYKLLLVGDGNKMDEVKEKVKTKGLNDYVCFTGMRKDVNRMLIAMDAFVYPSLWEGLPVSVVEAQASGLTCFISSQITSEVCITDLVQQIPLGLGASEWAEIIMKKNLPNCRQDMSCQIKESGYDIKDSSEWLSNFYTNLININK